MQRRVMDRALRACSTGRWVVAAAALVGAAACGDKTINEVSPPPALITVSSLTSGQTGTIGQPLATPVSVRVTDQAGNPVANAIVTWTVVTGGGSVATATSTTDGNGNASVIWTLGTTPGDNTLRGSIVTGASVTISATGVVPIGTTMTIQQGNDQTIGIGAATSPLVVMVTTAEGFPIPNVLISWAVTGGTLGQLKPASSTTDQNGQAFTIASAGVPTLLTVTATSPGLAPVKFNIIVID